MTTEINFPKINGTLGADITSVDCRVYLKDGTVIETNSANLALADLHHWQGWSCTAGVNHLSIDSNLNVFSCNKQNTNYGNIKDKDFKLPYKNDICKFDTCVFKQINLAMTKEKL